MKEKVQSLEQLKEQIEELRNILNVAMSKVNNEKLDIKVIELSKNLDIIINKYMNAAK